MFLFDWLMILVLGRAPFELGVSGLEFLSSGADGAVLHHHLDRSPLGSQGESRVRFCSWSIQKD